MQWDGSVMQCNVGWDAGSDRMGCGMEWEMGPNSIKAMSWDEMRVG